MIPPQFSTSSAPARKRLRVALSTTVAALALGGLVVGAVGSASAAVSTTYVAQSELGQAAPVGSDSAWTNDLSHGGTAAITTDAFDGATSLKLGIPAATPQAQSRVIRSFGPDLASTQTDLRAFLSGASYTYVGADVQFGVELYYTPVDAQYGPTGSSHCTAAVIGGVPSTTECYTTLKWEPLAATSTWTTVNVNQDVAADDTTSPVTAGWKTSSRVGTDIGQNNIVGHTLTDYLADMSSYQIMSATVQLGTQATGSGWVKSMSFAGRSYTFGDAPVTPPTSTPAPAAAPPVASDDALEQLIATQGIDVAATTDTFSVGGGAPGTGLDALDPSKPISGELPWTGQGDSYVDVYGYSSPIYLGTFPVVNGKVVLTGLDISALEAGGHHLVFLGQTSGALSVVAIAVDTLASTGANPMPYLVIGGVLLLLGVIALVIVTVRRRTRMAKH